MACSTHNEAGFRCWRSAPTPPPVVVVPGEIFLHHAEAGQGIRPIGATSRRSIPDEGSLAEAASMLNAASTVTILAGAGVAGAHDEALALAQAMQAPIGHALRGKEYIE